MEIHVSRCLKCTIGSGFLLGVFLFGSPSARAFDPGTGVEGVRVQLEEVTYQIDRDGNGRPIDHQVIDVFPLLFENQYGSVERTSEHGDYGASYFEVPAEDGGFLNHNIYLYIKDGPFGAVTDGYHNGRVPGSLFKLTALTLRREGDKVRARVMHVINPPPPRGESGRTIATSLRDIQKKVDLFLRMDPGSANH